MWHFSSKSRENIPLYLLESNFLNVLLLSLKCVYVFLHMDAACKFKKFLLVSYYFIWKVEKSKGGHTQTLARLVSEAWNSIRVSQIRGLLLPRSHISSKLESEVDQEFEPVTLLWDVGCPKWYLSHSTKHPLPSMLSWCALCKWFLCDLWVSCLPRSMCPCSNFSLHVLSWENLLLFSCPGASVDFQLCTGHCAE